MQQINLHKSKNQPQMETTFPTLTKIEEDRVSGIRDDKLKNWAVGIASKLKTFEAKVIVVMTDKGDHVKYLEVTNGIGDHEINIPKMKAVVIGLTEQKFTLNAIKGKDDCFSVTINTDKLKSFPNLFISKAERNSLAIKKPKADISPDSPPNAKPVQKKATTEKQDEHFVGLDQTIIQQKHHPDKAENSTPTPETENKQTETIQTQTNQNQDEMNRKKNESGSQGNDTSKPKRPRGRPVGSGKKKKKAVKKKKGKRGRPFGSKKKIVKKASGKRGRPIGSRKKSRNIVSPKKHSDSEKSSEEILLEIRTLTARLSNTLEKEKELKDQAEPIEAVVTKEDFSQILSPLFEDFNSGKDEITLTYVKQGGIKSKVFSVKNLVNYLTRKQKKK